MTEKSFATSSKPSLLLPEVVLFCHVAQASPRITLQRRLALSLWSSRLHLPPTGISGMHYYVWFVLAFLINPFLWGIGHISPKYFSLCLLLRSQVFNNYRCQWLVMYSEDNIPFAAKGSPGLPCFLQPSVSVWTLPVCYFLLLCFFHQFLKCLHLPPKIILVRISTHNLGLICFNLDQNIFLHIAVCLFPNASEISSYFLFSWDRVLLCSPG